MKPYEILYSALFPFTAPHYQMVRALLKKQANRLDAKPRTLLDIGGRKSPYTIGLDMDVTIIDLPRKSEIQKKLRLGLNDEYMDQLNRKRSNIRNVIIGDFLEYEFPPDAFDMIAAVEVIEHVPDDEALIKKCADVLNADGMGIFTTPNGDRLKVNREINPDHLRHYTKDQFAGRLTRYFDDVSVFYFARYADDLLAGLSPWKMRRPIRTFRSMRGNFRSYRQALNYTASDCAYLVAVVQKPVRKTRKPRQ